VGALLAAASGGTAAKPTAALAGAGALLRLLNLPFPSLSSPSLSRLYPLCSLSLVAARAAATAGKHLVLGRGPSRCRAAASRCTARSHSGPPARGRGVSRRRGATKARTGAEPPAARAGAGAGASRVLGGDPGGARDDLLSYCHGEGVLSGDPGGARDDLLSYRRGERVLGGDLGDRLPYRRGEASLSPAVDDARHVVSASRLGGGGGGRRCAAEACGLAAASLLQRPWMPPGALFGLAAGRRRR
jgi:hypothetical protein